MYVVAITELNTPLDAEATALAADLGTTLYEERLNLLAGLPAVVLTTKERGDAVGLLGHIRSRGQGALAVDTAAVVPSERMTPVKSFTFEADALRAGDDRLPYGEIVAILRAMHKSRTETRQESSSKEFSAGRALLSGGIMLTKKVTRDEKSVAHGSDQVLYVFRAGGATPWILRERGTQYGGLGAALAPSSAQNFLKAAACLREKAPQALYDERLLNARNASTRMSLKGTSSSQVVATSSAGGVDLLAHLIALWASKAPAR